ncbi:TSUP family transporter [Hohaiivirga grylli]|uniref:TSUP family transporter n=1 Tax=Hohaiivirga grylli TaxID=3133970 RepID=UPI00387E8519
MELDLYVLLSLGAVAFLAGFVDSIAGGGGLLTVPALVIAGLDPVHALGTNKLQGCMASFSATIAFARAKLIEWKSALPLALISAAGGILGTFSVEIIPNYWLQFMIPVLLVVVAFYFALSRGLGDSRIRARMSVGAFTFTIPLIVGFYDGVFGPGAGSFYMLGFVTLLGFGIIKATAHTKLLNFGSNFASLCVFSIKGYVILPIGLTMAVGAFLGAQIGSRLAMRIGPKLIRPLLVIVCCAMASKLLMDPANPLHAIIVGWLS